MEVGCKGRRKEGRLEDVASGRRKIEEKWIKAVEKEREEGRRGR